MQAEKRPIWHESSVEPNSSDASRFSLRQHSLMSRWVTPSGAGREIKPEVSCREENPGGPAGAGGEALSAFEKDGLSPVKSIRYRYGFLHLRA